MLRLAIEIRYAVVIWHPFVVALPALVLTLLFKIRIAVDLIHEGDDGTGNGVEPAPEAGGGVGGACQPVRDFSQDQEHIARFGRR
ncbi:hypothetical protein B5U98_29290 [Bosea sp. Tri-39]|nr:hypothetical protein BLM15_20105 [Bosea sp. Tri-49]RXT16103.1 hypothetical protein B5U98_29290 [Bosea sp. Tri-39]RXT39795.1 hypothetical protein B5U99_06335 [Bosea sp. Tri-54]